MLCTVNYSIFALSNEIKNKLFEWLNSYFETETETLRDKQDFVCIAI